MRSQQAYLNIFARGLKYTGLYVVPTEKRKFQDREPVKPRVMEIRSMGTRLTIPGLDVRAAKRLRSRNAFCNKCVRRLFNLFSEEVGKGSCQRQTSFVLFLSIVFDSFSFSFCNSWIFSRRDWIVREAYETNRHWKVIPTVPWIFYRFRERNLRRTVVEKTTTKIFFALSSIASWQEKSIFGSTYLRTQERFCNERSAQPALRVFLFLFSRLLIEFGIICGSKIECWLVVRAVRYLVFFFYLSFMARAAVGSHSEKRRYRKPNKK